MKGKKSKPSRAVNPCKGVNMQKLKMKDLYVGLLVYKDGVPLRCLDPFGFTATFEVCKIDKHGKAHGLREFVRYCESQLVFD